MSAHNRELEPQPTLTEQVMTACREAYDTLYTFRYRLPYGIERADKMPETKALSREIGSFVTANSAALVNIVELARTPELKEAADAWLEAMVQCELMNAKLTQIEKQKKAKITELLEGRTVKATSLSRFVPVEDGYSAIIRATSSEEIEAPFLGVEPAQGVSMAWNCRTELSGSSL